MKDVYFVVKDIEGKTYPSNYLLGKMVSDKLNNYGMNTKVVDSIQNLKDSILILNGSLINNCGLNKHLLEMLKNKKNKLVLNPCDYCIWMTNEELALYPYIDAFIFPNTQYKNMIKGLTDDQIISVIPHHYDHRFDGVKVEKRKDFCVGYFGVPYNDKYFIPDTSPDWLIYNLDLRIGELEYEAQKFHVHFSHRSPKSLDFYFKPATKLAIAAASNVAFMTSKDTSVMDFLPEDYPLFISEDIDDLNSKYELLKSKFGTNEWKDYVGFISNLKDKFDLNYQQKDYKELFERLSK